MKKRPLVNQLANGQHTVSEIAYRAGVAESTVREYVRRGRKEGKDLKYKYVQTPPWSDSDIEELKKLREQGLTYRAIAKQFGTTAPWVYKLINNKRKNMFQDIKRMHKHYNRNYEGRPRPLPPKEDELRIKLLREELAEYEEAVTLEEKFDALIDLVVVALGAAELHGFPFEEGWQRVLKANMAKRVAKTPEESKRGVIGDLVKPSNWTPPNLKDLVE